MNAVVGQSGGPTTVINSSLAGVYETAVRLGAEKVYGMQNGIGGFLQEQLVVLNELLDSAEKVELLKRTPACYLGSCRHKLKSADVNPEEYETIFRVLEKYDIGWFFYIGGNDSQDTVAKLSAYAEKIGSKVRFVGVPKTIDNDLMLTDHTPGYGSAAKFVATAMKELVRDCAIYDLNSVTIVEVMGRNAGWLTAASALAKGDDCEGVDMIFLPETPFTMEDFIEKIRTRFETKKNLVIAVSEGIQLPDGRYVCELASSDQKTDAFGHKQLTGTALFLAGECNRILKVKARAIEFSTLQRCAGHIASLTDINEAYDAGRAAVQAAADGKSGVVSVFVRASNDPYRCETKVVDVHEIANREKCVPVEWIDTVNADMLPPFIEYARPLIQGELPPYYVDGLPAHLTLKTK